MSQNTASHDPRARSERAGSEEEDTASPRIRQPEHKQPVRPRRPVGQPDGDGLGPDEPDEGEFEIIGDNDLGAPDLGPLAPNADPDAGSGRIRKIT
jgi:hypothetical protein